jgi:hypothetical protein
MEVDMEIPQHLHDYLDQLPLAPEVKCPPNSKTPKLLLTHSPKSHYLIHSRLLQIYLKLGVKVTAVHRAIHFKQSYVFKAYVDYNTERRAQVSSVFEKNFYKLKNNALYGKTVEKQRKHKDVRLCNTPDKLETYASRPTFQKAFPIADDLVALLLKKEFITLDRPIFIGQAVLDISKCRMYDLHYVDLQAYREEFNCSLNIVAGDTDSFFLECVDVDLTSQLLPAMKRDGLLDTSNYAPDHPLYSKEYASKIGLIKDESGGVAAYKEWLFLRPKVYSLLTDDAEKGVRKAKGVQRHVVQNVLKHSQYKSSLVEQEVIYTKQRRIGSERHQLYTLETNKKSLSANDDKRVWLDAYHSRAYGHYLN